MKAYKNNFKFIDLFAGIGGFRYAFEAVGGKCVFSSEWDKYAADTYEANFGHRPAGDITKIKSEEIPDHEILTAGFPCQPFSIAGVSKHNALGTAHGFEHPTQGTLFFEVARIIRDKKPKVFLLENVKNLKGHDRGRTIAIILDTLRNELGYFVPEPRVVDARKVVPQHRERIYIIGFLKEQDAIKFQFPEINDRKPKLREILEDQVDAKYTLSDNLWQYLQGYAQKHKEKGNGFGFSLADLNGVTRTLSARYYKDGSEILIPQGSGMNPRRLTPKECAKLMGFPVNHKIVCSDTRSYKQFGNAVVVPLVTEIANALTDTLFGSSVQVSASCRISIQKNFVLLPTVS